MRTAAAVLMALLLAAVPAAAERASLQKTPEAPAPTPNPPVVLTPTSGLDAGVVSIETPGAIHADDATLYPSGTVQNLGTVDITDDFDVTCEITDGARATVYACTLTHAGTITVGSAEPVTFGVAWQPTLTGVYYVTMTATLAGDVEPSNDSASGQTEIVEHYGTGGPDAMGYEWIDSREPGGPTYDWIEISGTGTSAITYGVPSFEGDDNFSEPVPIGFTFPFYGVGRTECNIDVNGEMLLNLGNNWYEPYPDSGWGSDGNMFNYMYPIPGYTMMPALIAPYWDDLLAVEGVSDVYFQTFGEAPDRYFVVEWHDLKFCYGTVEDTTLTFEVVLHENGDVVFQYQDTGIGQTGSTTPHDDGAGATVAIQNDDGDIGLCYLTEIISGGSYQGVVPPGNLLQDELAIKFHIETDEQSPAFVYEELGNTFDTTPDFTLTITDASGVASDSLYFNYGEGWAAVTHDLFEPPNVYHYTLPEVPTGVPLMYYFAATDSAAAENRGTYPAAAPADYFSFRMLPTAGVEVLIATPGTQDWQNTEFPVYSSALDAADVVYDVYSWYREESYRFPNSYKTIFAYSNSFNTSDKTDTLAVALMDFLDMGTTSEPKNLFFSSDNMGSYQSPMPDAEPIARFFRAYLRAQYVPVGNETQPPFGGTDGIGGPDIYGYSYGSMIGLTGTPIGDNGVEIPTYSDTPDVIVNRVCPEVYAGEVTNPDISSWGSFAFQDGPYSGDAYAKGMGAAVWLNNLIYKSFFITFDMSQLTNGVDAMKVIRDAVAWFNVPDTGVGEPDDGGTTPRLALEQNRPNPFNPTTSIAYSLQGAGSVNVTVYDVSGRKVRTLVDSRQEAGPHSVTWDGCNDRGEVVGSGVYLYRMETDGYSASKKMVLMK